MSVPLELRRYRESDLDELHALIVRTIRGSYPAHYPPRAVQFFIDYHSREKIAADGSSAFIIVAMLDGRMIGTATLADSSVGRVFVAPELQGEGIGTALMDRIESEARQLGLTELVLDASLPAFNFYQDRGYRKCSEDRLDVGNGEELRYYPMDKPL